MKEALGAAVHRAAALNTPTGLTEEATRDSAAVERPGKDRGAGRLDSLARRLSAARWPRAMLSLPKENVRCPRPEGSGCYGHNGAHDMAALSGRPVDHARQSKRMLMQAQISRSADRRSG